MQTTILSLWIKTSNRVREARENVDERGLTTTEVAVLTFVLVGIAVAVGAVLLQFATDTVNESQPDLDQFQAPVIE